MKKHVDANHFALMKKVEKDPSITPWKIPFSQKVDKNKSTCISIYNMWVFFSK
jgi:hypothetical protein